MPELCSFCWNSIFSKASGGSQDITRNIPLELKQMTDYCFRRVKTVSQEAFFGQMVGVSIFFENFDPIFYNFFVNKRTNAFLQKKLCWFTVGITVDAPVTAVSNKINDIQCFKDI